MKNISILLKSVPFFIEATLLFLFGVIQNNPRLINSSLVYDELLAWEWENGSWENLFSGGLNDTQQVLYYVFAKAFLLVAPVNNDYWVRVPSLVLGSAAFLGVFYYIRKNYSWLTALYFVVAVVFHPLISYAASYNRPYAMLLFLMGINVCLAHSIFVQRKTENEWLNWSFLITLLAMGYTHYLSFFYWASLLAGIVAARGFDSVLKFMKSPLKKLVFFLGFVTLIMCFIYQFQFRDRLSWVYSTHPSLKTSLWQTFGLGGVFLLVFFLRLNKFKDRDPTEKFLSVGVLVGLFQICVLRFWVDRYMIVLLPFSLWLSALYLEKVIHFIRQSSLITRYTFVGIMGVGFLLSPPLVDTVLPGMAFGSVSSDISRIFRLGNLHGVKHLFSAMKEAHLVFPETKILCVDGPALALHPLEQYSKMYWGKDICTEYTNSFNSSTELSKYHYLLHLKAGFADTFETIKGSDLVSKKYLSSLSVSNSYQLYRIESSNKL